MVPPANTTVMVAMNARAPHPESASQVGSGQDHHLSVLVSETRK